MGREKTRKKEESAGWLRCVSCGWWWVWSLAVGVVLFLADCCATVFVAGWLLSKVSSLVDQLCDLDWTGAGRCTASSVALTKYQLSLRW